MILNQIQEQLIHQARELHGNIHPCGDKRTLAECFTEELGRVQLWFNIDGDHSTRMLEADQ